MMALDTTAIVWDLSDGHAQNSLARHGNQEFEALPFPGVLASQNSREGDRGNRVHIGT